MAVGSSIGQSTMKEHMHPAFDVIPVIDLLGGQVVHARAGERDRYRPLASTLCRGSAPLDVVAALRALHPFRRLYIADLDAIRKTGDHGTTIRTLGQSFPDLDIWVDGGFAAAEDCRAFLDGGKATLVLGSESQRDGRLLAALGQDPRLVLSLDYKGDAALGPAAIHDHAESWPARVIVMTLAAVGGVAGPDFQRLAEVRARAGGRALFAAGGVRGPADLELLAREGHAGVLVASALHDGRIGRADLQALE
jgi:phosphoribosylformimino-5-aminoimidazole carboxamide ribotide isomerase